MMRDELINEISRLPLDEKLLLLEALTRTVREELIFATASAQSRTDVLDSDVIPSFDELRGVLVTDAPIPPDYDWKDDYADYLMKKYA